jgi:ubiquinone/menaquinone biosynthesis methyltransferase
MLKLSRQIHALRRYNTNATHFGFKTVQEGEKQQMVSEVFHKVADKYDVMNDAMSLGVHRLWKDCFVGQLDPKPGCNYIDLAGGTGDIAFRIADKIRSKSTVQNDRSESNILVCDINTSMLGVGQERYAKQNHSYPNLSFLEQNAENLEKVESNMYDAYTISFGIRNVPRISKALSEAYRVLKPGGVFMCLEFSHVENPVLASIYDIYSMNVIPEVGNLVAGDRDSYQYLVESIRKFPTQEDFKEMIKDAGFKFVSYRNMTGGIVAIHRGIKI